MQWHDVARENSIAPGEYVICELADVEVLVANLDGNLYAVENTCTHDGGSLEGACIQNNEIVCPRHGARFCLQTGAVTSPPAYEDLETYPIRILDGRIQVGDQAQET